MNVTTFTKSMLMRLFSKGAALIRAAIDMALLGLLTSTY